MPTPTNDFLPFAAASGANVESQADYAADAALGPGFTSGVAFSAKCNKVWRQSSFVAAGVSQFILNVLSISVSDDGNLPNWVANFTAAIQRLIEDAGFGGGTVTAVSASSSTLNVSVSNPTTTPNITANLKNQSGLSPGTYTDATVTVNAQGIITAISSGVGSAAPSGTVVAFVGTTAPSGWLLMQGQAVSRTTYANLNALASAAGYGAPWGHGDGSTTFNLPDTRGQFIRGFDAGAGVDSGRAFGSEQADSFEAHHHLSGVGVTTGSPLPFVYGGASTDTPGAAGSTAHTDSNTVQSQSITSTADSANPTHGTATETRPKNIALNYIIKT